MATTRLTMAQPLRTAFELRTRTLRLPPTFLLPFQQQHREASGKTTGKAQPKKKKKKRPQYDCPDLKKIPQFPLLDAMRYLKACEVGGNPTSAKYELHVRFKTQRDAPGVRNRMRLPHPVSTAVRIACICAPASPEAAAATKAGAVLVGEDVIFDMIREGNTPFDRLLCHPDSLAKLNKLGFGRILGPRGLMPNVKSGTITKELAKSVSAQASASEYRERRGVVNLAIGQIGFTPKELQRNIHAVMEQLKKDVVNISSRVSKEIYEIVLSSTKGPGLSLDGTMSGPNSPAIRDMAVN